MSYRRVLLIVELGGDAAPAAAAIRRLAPEAERLVVVAHAPGRDIALLSHDAPGDRDAAASSLEALRAVDGGPGSQRGVDARRGARRRRARRARGRRRDRSRRRRAAPRERDSAPRGAAQAPDAPASLDRRRARGRGTDARDRVRRVRRAGSEERSPPSSAITGAPTSDARSSARRSPTHDSPRRFRWPGSRPASSSRRPARPASRRPTSSWCCAFRARSSPSRRGGRPSSCSLLSPRRGRCGGRSTPPTPWISAGRSASGSRTTPAWDASSRSRIRRSRSWPADGRSRGPAAGTDSRSSPPMTRSRSACSVPRKPQAPIPSPPSSSGSR